MSERHVAEPAVPDEVIRAFEDRYGRLFDLSRDDHEWRNTVRYKHPHIQSTWEGWRDCYLASRPAAPKSPVPPAGEDDDESEWFEIIEWVPTAVTLLVARFDVEVGEWVIGVEGPITAASAKAAGWSHFHRLPDGLPKNYSPKAPRPAPVPPAGEWCICQDCQRPYDFDLLVPDDVWNRIRPAGTPEGGGLLCPNCLLRRTGWTAARATDAAPKPAVAEPVAWPGRKFCEIAERNATELAKWIKGKDDKQVVSDAALAIRTLLASPPATETTRKAALTVEQAKALDGYLPSEYMLAGAALHAVRAIRALIETTEGSGAANE